MPGPARPGFHAGQSGNPAGRPRGTLTAEIAKAAREHGPEGIERLVAWMRSADYKASIPAIVELLNRGYGKAPQEITGPNGGAIDIRVVAAARLAKMTDEEFHAFDAEFRKAVGDGDVGGDVAPDHGGGEVPP